MHAATLSIIHTIVQNAGILSASHVARYMTTKPSDNTSIASKSMDSRSLDSRSLENRSLDNILMASRQKNSVQTETSPRILQSCSNQNLNLLRSLSPSTRRIDLVNELEHRRAIIPDLVSHRNPLITLGSST